MAYVDLDNTPYWSDYQTNEQYFGLLAFDPGEEESVCYVDGDASEWTQEDVVLETGQGTLSMKYDEKFLYFYALGLRPGGGAGVHPPRHHPQDRQHLLRELRPDL